MNLKKKKIILDCDPGIDDALAILLALSCPELDIVGITTVSGNVPSPMGAENALKILDFMGRRDIPVYCGAEKPLYCEYISAQDTHGEDGLGESGIEPVKGATFQSNAADFILNTLRTDDGVGILAIGPLTNIAQALSRDKSAFKKMGMFVSMGGCFKSYGNCSPVAEYNYWCDPDAAAAVYKNLGQIIHMVCLDVTRRIVLTPNILEYMRRLEPRIGSFIQSITQFYFDFHWKQEGLIGCVINDPLAVAYFIEPDMCKGFDFYTSVATDGLCRGQTVVDEKNFTRLPPNSHVLTQTDPFAFMRFFLSRVFGKSISEIEPVLKQIMG